MVSTSAPPLLNNKHLQCPLLLWTFMLVRPFDILHTLHRYYLLCRHHNRALCTSMSSLSCLHPDQSCAFRPAAASKSHSCLQMCVQGFCCLVEPNLQIIQLILVLISPLTSCKCNITRIQSLRVIVLFDCPSHRPCS